MFIKRSERVIGMLRRKYPDRVWEYDPSGHMWCSSEGDGVFWEAILGGDHEEEVVGSNLVKYNTGFDRVCLGYRKCS